MIQNSLKTLNSYASTHYHFIFCDHTSNIWNIWFRTGRHLASFDASMYCIVTDPEGKYESLEKYGKDLTAMAKAGKLDPVIGRDDEIRRCIQILSRRTKNNPVLIGEPGVGKTAISEG
uniref:Uncharacterized protein n=1 Tax=Nelumbo nucifera TaxID=4432 RepID=A0A822YGZ4_NELNU|nr:TPA_asm: hypothetical protein HUJ06_010254 [Nelumbo nucifera]